MRETDTRSFVFLKVGMILVLIQGCELQPTTRVRSNSAVSNGESNKDNAGDDSNVNEDTGGLPCGTVPHGGFARRLRYESSQVAAGSLCSDVSQEQVALCTNGVLGSFSGTYQYDTCRVAGYASCGVIPHGDYERRTRYQNSLVPYGQMCARQEQSRLCNNGLFGLWSGTYTNTTCVVQGAASCGTTPSGGQESRVMYQAATVPYGQRCQLQTQTRTCTNGAFGSWSGTYTQASCSVQGAASCGTTPSGGQESRVMYLALSVPYGQQCQMQTQTRTCTNGVFGSWTGTYAHPTCSVQLGASCDGVAHGQNQSRTMYQASSVAAGQVCRSEVQLRACNNGSWGIWSGTYANTACLVQNGTRPRLVHRWSLGPNSGGAIGLDSAQSYHRSMAATHDGQRLLMTRTDLRNTLSQVVVFDAKTRANDASTVTFLNVSGISPVSSGAAIGAISAAADGAIYATNLTAYVPSPLLRVHRWSSPSPSAVPEIVFQAQVPAAARTQTGLYMDALVVGTTTYLILSSTDTGDLYLVSSSPTWHIVHLANAGPSLGASNIQFGEQNGDSIIVYIQARNGGLYGSEINLATKTVTKGPVKLSNNANYPEGLATQDPGVIGLVGFASFRSSPTAAQQALFATVEQTTAVDRLRLFSAERSVPSSLLPNVWKPLDVYYQQNLPSFSTSDSPNTFLQGAIQVRNNWVWILNYANGISAYTIE